MQPAAIRSLFVFSLLAARRDARLTKNFTQNWYNLPPYNISLPCISKTYGIRRISEDTKAAGAVTILPHKITSGRSFRQNLNEAKKE